jgi:hypothetical protein
MVEKIIFSLQESYRHIIFLPLKSSLYFLSLLINHFLSIICLIFYLNLHILKYELLYPVQEFLYLCFFFSLLSFFFINTSFIRYYLKFNYKEIKLIKTLEANPDYIRQPLILTSLFMNFCSLLLIINLFSILYNKIGYPGLGFLNLGFLFSFLFLLSSILLVGIVYYLCNKEFAGRQ